LSYDSFFSQFSCRSAALNITSEALLLLKKYFFSACDVSGTFIPAARTFLSIFVSDFQPAFPDFFLIIIVKKHHAREKKIAKMQHKPKPKSPTSGFQVRNQLFEKIEINFLIISAFIKLMTLD